MGKGAKHLNENERENGSCMAGAGVQEGKHWVGKESVDAGNLLLCLIQ